MCAIAVFGGPGSGAIVAQTLAALAPIRTDLRLIGFLNDVLPRGEHVSGTPVFGPFSSWRDLPEDVSFVAPLHKAGAMQQRVAIVQGLGIPEHRWATIIDPRSAVAADAVIGPGSFVGPFATVGPATRIGSHVVVRGGACVSHDCNVADFVFVGTNAVVCGYSSVGDGGYIAPSATIRDGCSIGRFATVGLGSVVVKNVPDFITVAGSPARRIVVQRQDVG